MGLARAAALVARGWSQEAVRRAGERAVEGLRALIAPFAPAVLAGLPVRGAALGPLDHHPLRHGQRPSLGPSASTRVIATRYEVRDGRHTGRLEAGSSGASGKLRAARRWAGGRRDPWRSATPVPTVSSTMPLLASVGFPHAVNPDLGLGVVALAPGTGPSSTGTARRGCPPSRGSSPTTCFAPLSDPRPSPTPASRSPASSTIPRARARCCWPPTTAATSTWRRWPSWSGRQPDEPPGAIPGQAQETVQGCQVRSARWVPKAIGRHRRLTGAGAATAEALLEARPRPPCGPARWWSSFPRGRSLVASPSSRLASSAAAPPGSAPALAATATGVPVIPDRDHRHRGGYGPARARVPSTSSPCAIRPG